LFFSVLNIYGLSTPLSSSSQLDFSSLAQDCVSIRLNFVPFKLTHSNLLVGCAREKRSDALAAPDIILAGSDRNVHVYRHSGLAYSELPLNTSHPLSMLQGTASSALSLDIACTSSSSHTFLVAGYQDGLVRFASLTGSSQRTPTSAAADDDAPPKEEAGGSSWQLGEDDDGVEEEEQWTDFYLDGPVNSASFFSPSSTFLRDVFRSRSQAKEALNDNSLNRMQRRAFDACVAPEGTAGQSEKADDRIRPRSNSETLMPEVRLLMANAIGFGTVYSSLDASSLSFSNSCYLNGSGCHSSSDFSSLVDPSSDSILCTAAVDINMDGRNEVLLGTYSSQMLVFQETFDGATTGAAGFDEGEEESALEGYALAAKKQFAYPVYVSCATVSSEREWRWACHVATADLLCCCMHFAPFLLVHPERRSPPHRSGGSGRDDAARRQHPLVGGGIRRGCTHQQTGVCGGDQTTRSGPGAAQATATAGVDGIGRENTARNGYSGDGTQQCNVGGYTG
jgi:hypothetical protein